MIPPIASCQPASTSGGAGDPHLLSKIDAIAMMPVAAKAASAPVTSMPCALGPSKITNPMMTQSAAATDCAIGRCLRMPQVRPMMKTGCEAPIMEARLPGRWYAARNKSGKNNPKLRNARTALFHHQSPLGNCRANRMISRPIGSERTSESSSGRPAGKKSVVKRKLVPHTRGATAVTRISVNRRIS